METSKKFKTFFLTFLIVGIIIYGFLYGILPNLKNEGDFDFKNKEIIQNNETKTIQKNDFVTEGLSGIINSRNSTGNTNIINTGSKDSNILTGSKISAADIIKQNELKFKQDKEQKKEDFLNLSNKNNGLLFLKGEKADLVFSLNSKSIKNKIDDFFYNNTPKLERKYTQKFLEYFYNNNLKNENLKASFSILFDDKVLTMLYSLENLLDLKYFFKSLEKLGEYHISFTSNKNFQKNIKSIYEGFLNYHIDEKDEKDLEKYLENRTKIFIKKSEKKELSKSGEEKRLSEIYDLIGGICNNFVKDIKSKLFDELLNKINFSENTFTLKSESIDDLGKKVIDNKYLFKFLQSVDYNDKNYLLFFFLNTEKIINNYKKVNVIDYNKIYSYLLNTYLFKEVLSYEKFEEYMNMFLKSKYIGWYSENNNDNISNTVIIYLDKDIKDKEDFKKTFKKIIEISIFMIDNPIFVEKIDSFMEGLNVLVEGNNTVKITFKSNINFLDIKNIILGYFNNEK